MPDDNSNFPKAWILAVDMGYGHQRTAYPLRYLMPDSKAINANHYEGIPAKDRMIWETSRSFYEFISNFKRVPLIGSASFSFFNKFQKILTYYPKRDMSQPDFGVRRVFSLIKRGWGRNLIESLKTKNEKLGENLPLISAFFTPAFMAEFFGYSGSIYCVICDADIARSWVPLEPEKTKIKYFAPCNWVVERLKLYGVRPENIFLTGYPLPKENIGAENKEVLRQDISSRLLNLDPKNNYHPQYQPLIEKYIGRLPAAPDHPLTLMFSVGGAGAQKEIVIKFVKSLLKKVKNSEIKIILAAGVKESVQKYFVRSLRLLRAKNFLGKEIEIISSQNLLDYFGKFNLALRKTDILWTKPSELSFYAGLGIPIIIAPSIGSQEDFNRKWLLGLGAGILSEDPKYADQWIFDYLNSGRFAEMAMQGFIEVENLGTFNIEKIIAQKK